MSKYKSKTNAGTPEVHSARSKLDGVLKTLVDKKEQSPVLDHQFKVELDALGEALPVTPPKKCVSTKQSRKRKRSKEEVSSIEMGQYHHTYVMKLFDRSVDLAQFDENSPLYPICRAWMKNQPHNRGVNSGERSMVLDLPIPLDDDEDEGNIYKLDSPQQIKTEDGHFLSRSLPSPVPQPEERLDIHADESEALPGEDLLSTHMHRWREIRQKWKDAARKNEAFCAPSLDMLKDMFDRHCKD